MGVRNQLVIICEFHHMADSLLSEHVPVKVHWPSMRVSYVKYKLNNISDSEINELENASEVNRKLKRYE